MLYFNDICLFVEFLMEFKMKFLINKYGDVDQIVIVYVKIGNCYLIIEQEIELKVFIEENQYLVVK